MDNGPVVGLRRIVDPFPSRKGGEPQNNGMHHLVDQKSFSTQANNSNNHWQWKIISQGADALLQVNIQNKTCAYEIPGFGNRCDPTQWKLDFQHSQLLWSDSEGHAQIWNTDTGKAVNSVLLGLGAEEPCSAEPGFEYTCGLANGLIVKYWAEGFYPEKFGQVIAYSIAENRLHEIGRLELSSDENLEPLGICLIPSGHLAVWQRCHNHDRVTVYSLDQNPFSQVGCIEFPKDSGTWQHRILELHPSNSHLIVVMQERWTGASGEKTAQLAEVYQITPQVKQINVERIALNPGENPLALEKIMSLLRS